MKQPRKPRAPDCLVRVGAMARPRDVQPGLVPVQYVDPRGGPSFEFDMPAELIARGEVVAERRGVTLEEALLTVMLTALRQHEEGSQSD